MTGMIEGRSWYLGNVCALCYLVERGKLAAWLLVPTRYLAEVQKTISQDGCSCKVTETEQSEWSEVWIYSTPLAAELIEAVPHVRASLPKAVAEWYLGQLFGYSDAAIEAYIADPAR